MKTLNYSFFALGLLATVSCNDDDQTPTPEPLPVNAVSYNGKNYTIDNGSVIDWGSWEDHYNYDFFLTDGEMDFENETAVDATVMVYAELWSPGTESFTTGTFNYDNSGVTGDKRFFENAAVVMDTNNNADLDENDDHLTVKAGSFKVSGSGTSYTVEVDVTLSNNKLLKGRYSGTFEIIEGSIEEMPGGRRRAGQPGKFIPNGLNLFL